MTGFPFIGTLTAAAELLVSRVPRSPEPIQPLERLASFVAADRAVVTRAAIDYESLTALAGMFKGALVTPDGENVLELMRICQKGTARDLVPDIASAYFAGTDAGWFVPCDSATRFWIAYIGYKESSSTAGWPMRHERLRIQAARAANETLETGQG
ncbi:MAG: hypothetical protein GY720_19685 [bacterium]|nr:hypothetical protein [bacterium]